MGKDKDTRSRKASDSEGGDIQAMVKTLVTKFCTSADFIENLTESITTAIKTLFEERLDNLQRDSDLLRATVNKQNEVIQRLSRKLEVNEQYARRKSLRIYGLQDIEGKDLKQTVVEKVGQRIGVKFSVDDLEMCYRTGKNQERGKRGIIVRFSTLRLKRNVYRNKSALKGTKLVVREDLTDGAMELVKESITRFGSKKVWTNEGSVFVKTGDNGVHKIYDMQTLEKLGK